MTGTVLICTSCKREYPIPSAPYPDGTVMHCTQCKACKGQPSSGK